MIESLEFIKDHRCFKQGEKLEFHPGLNLLVGDQGSGKSTVLTLLREHSGALGEHAKKETEKISTVNTSKIKMAVVAFDFEKDNPRVQSHFAEKMDFGFQVKARWSSHGQVVNVIVGTLDQISKPTIVIADEPDLALSMRSVLKLSKIFKNLVEKKCQVIAAVHHPWVIERADEVYSLEHRKWMTPSAFICALNDNLNNET